MTEHEIKALFGRSSNKNFRVARVVSLPAHEFAFSSRNVIGTELADSVEASCLGAHVSRALTCAHPGCNRPYAAHTKVLLVECAEAIAQPNSVLTNEELLEYLKKATPLCKSHGFNGFAFVRVEGPNS